MATRLPPKYDSERHVYRRVGPEADEWSPAHIALAPFRLKSGVSEEALVSASDAFEREFARKHDGIVRRILVGDDDGGFADVVFFQDEAAIARVIEAERNSEVCAAFFSVMDGDDAHSVYEVIKSYD